MRRVTLLVALVALVASSPANARPSAAGVAFTGGSGRVVINLRGSLLGTVDRGRLTVRVNSTRTQVFVDGTTLRQRITADGRVVYIGTKSL